MSGSRRIQRSVRVSVAVTLVVLSALGVASALATSHVLGAAAVLCVVCGVVALRIAYAEIVSTRGCAARDKAEQARAFGAAQTATHADHRAYASAMSDRIAERDRAIELRDRAIRELKSTITLADGRAEEAIRRAETADGRLSVEVARADLAEARLSELLDEVLAPPASLVTGGVDDADQLPTVVDLLAWEERVSDSTAASPVEGLRREA
ncbi:MAG: hypothetical protein ACR2JU_15725 [Nocardioidaceae bacterium]